MRREESSIKTLALALTLSIVFWAALSGSPLAQERYAASYAGFAGYQVPLWAAKDVGLLAKYELNVDLVFVPGAARGVQALLSGSTHFALVDPTSPLTAMLQGADLILVAGSLNKFPFSLVTRKEIRKREDLVGKKIGIVSFGGSNELSIVLALKEWNIPRQAVTLLASGSAANRLVGLFNKALDATVLAPPETGEAVRMGLNILAHLSDLKASFPMNVVAVRRSFQEKNRGVVKCFLQAYTEAIYEFMTNKEKGLFVYNQRLKQKNTKALEETYQYFAPKFSFPPRVSHEGLRSTLDLVAQRAPGAKGETTLDRFLDESLIDELEREGFFRRLNQGPPRK